MDERAILDLAKSVGLPVLSELLRRGAAAVFGDDAAPPALVTGAIRVRDVLPDVLPTDVEGSKLDAAIAKAERVTPKDPRGDVVRVIDTPGNAPPDPTDDYAADEIDGGSK